MTVTRNNLLMLTAVLAVIAFAFLPSLFNGFTNFDDDSHVWSNPSIINNEGIVSIFQSHVNKTYIPLTVLSFKIEYSLFGLHPFFYHFNNLLLHLAVAALIFFLGLRLRLAGWTAAAAALLFGIHPMHVESVAWITQRKDVLYSVFYLAAVYAYWHYLEQKSKPAYVFSMIFGLLSILVKPMALSLPLILLLCDWFHGRKPDKNMWLDKIPFVLYIIPIAWITYTLNAREPVTTALQAALIWAWSFSFYILKFIFPLDLSPLYALPQPVNISNPVYLFAWIVSLLFCAGVWIGRKNKWIVFAAGFYMLSIFFLLRFDDFDFTIVADRYMYLPSTGICFLAGAWLELGAKHLNARRWGETGKIAAVILLGALTVALAFKTFSQCRIWKDGVTVWSAMIPHNPENAFVLHLRAQAYEARGNYDAALEDYTQVLELDSKYLMAYNNRGMIFLRYRLWDQALKDFNTMISLDSSFAQSYSNRSFVHLSRGHFDLALADLNKTLELDPQLTPAYGNRGLVHLEMKNYDAAIKDFSDVLKRSPNSSQWHYLRSVAYAQSGRLSEALSDADHARILGHPGIDQHIQMLQAAQKSPD